MHTHPQDQNEVERQVIYYDLDGDGKISSGDMISLTFPSDEFIQFVDNSRGETVAIHGDEDTTAVIYRDMTCQEQFGENVCENYVSFYDASTGEWYSIRMCFMKPEGEDCNGTPISDS